MQTKQLNYLPAQQNVIDFSGDNQLVSASAGSGKTTVMIQKIANLLTSTNLEIDQILVLTFTKAAAAEMKQKLFEKLAQAVQADTTLQPKLDALANANISTIDSFCQKLLSKYFYAINLDPAFKVLDETSSLYYKSKAFDKAIDKLLEEHAEEWNCLAEVYGAKRNDQVLRDMTTQLDFFLQSQQDASAWLSLAARSYFLEPQKAYQEWNQMFTQRMAILAQQIEITIANFAKHGMEKGASYFEALKASVKQLNAKQTLFQNAAMLECITYPNIKSANDGDEDFYNKAKAFKDYCKSQLDDWKKKMPTNQQAEQAASQAVLRQMDALILLQSLFAEQYALIKAAKKSLDYTDLEKKALELLRIPEISASVRTMFKHVFVDEYQDINELQEELLTLLSQNNNRFMVGDSKQSIYAFRNSNPKIIMDKGEQYATNQGGVLQHLNANFRSNPAILHFVNQLFAFSMRKETGGINYYPDSMFEPKAKYEQSPVPAVQVLLAQQEKRQTPKQNWQTVYSVAGHDMQYEKMPETNLEKEARMIANAILQLSEQPIYDAGKKEWRPTKFNDFTILLRKRKHMHALQEALIAFGVPAVANVKPALLENEYAMQMLALLKVLSCFEWDEPLICVMLSAFGGFYEHELATIKLYSPSAKFFYECVQNVGQNPLAPLHQKVSAFIKTLHTWKKTASRFGITAMFNQAMQAVNYELVVLHQTNGNETKVNTVRRFASFFEQSPFAFQLDEFLDYANKNESKLSVWVMAATNVGQVNITTMHASKGLEFPIVILPFCGEPLCSHHDNPDLIVSGKYGIALKHINSEEQVSESLVQWHLIEHEKNAQDFAEALRVWYVALTRAKNHLICTATVKPDDIEQATNYDYPFRTDSLIDLVVKALPQQQKKEWLANQTLRVNSELHNYSIAYEPAPTAQTKAPTTVALSLTNNQTELINSQLNKVLFYQIEPSKLYLKNSVSSIVKHGEEEFAYQPILEESGETSFAELGTAFHAIFEQLDYSKPITLQSVNELLSQAQTKNLFHRDISQLVSAQRVVDCANVLQPLLQNKQVFKEKKFMMKVAASSVIDGADNTKILVQGVVDLLALGEQNYLFDFKLTKNQNTVAIVQKYKKQIALYKTAIEQALGKGIDKCFLVLIATGQLLEVDL